MPHYEHAPGHRNLNHFNPYLYALQTVGANYNAADRTIDETAAVTLATVTLTFTTAIPGYMVPLGFICNVRPGTIIADSILDIWYTIDGVQRSAKFPVSVFVAALGKTPLTLPAIPRTVLDVIQWASKRTANPTIAVVAQRQADANPAGSTILVSDTGMQIDQAVGDSQTV